ncbi:L,D-transpeptidase family protein [Cellvibrio fibrivorans]|uniref:Murein L,D-transpeptidase YcbB/YkuD n=1 Tax=Cellvibrio fibrivorans TaxID=126350 RepID=A0ABU1UYV3_9GAMM|nr:L,D-transpeptidase family protein [Cellvibrio fibrivorans]MDR7090387.1 murein L,D-transpeptidase YcbB/YkuD [Cellvibrio fibrivorans]
MTTSAEGSNPTTTELGKMLSSSTLIAREIEVQMVALQLDVAEGRQTLDSRHLTQAVIGFYEQRQYRPIWDQAGRLEQLIGALESVEADGLTPEDYQVEQLRHALPLLGDNSPEAIPLRVADELRATNAYLRALYHLYNGKVDPAGLDPQWNFELQDMAPVADGARVADSIETGQIAQLFEQTRPQHPIYRSFKAGLQQYRQLALLGGWPSLPVGATLKPCAVDPQVAILRQRLRVTGEYIDPVLPDAGVNQSPAQICLIANAKAASLAASSRAASSVADELSPTMRSSGQSSSADSVFTEEAVFSSQSSAQSSSVAPVNPDEVFDEYLVEAVKKFQREQYLEVDGAIGPATRAALNVSVQSRIDQIRVNLDRARWLLHNIPPEMLLVDVAGFKITYFKASQPIWRSRVQVGMAYRTSPIFKSEVNYITLNPTWTVPPTILRKDVLPKVRKDINYLREHNIRVLDSSGKQLDPATIDWYKPGNITLRQDAGEDAALGKAVIRFPNAYAVYLHDTPHQKLFNKSQRAFSSGCIRVERALELVELLLAETPSWDSAAINKALATGKTRNVTLAKRVPILLAYWTVDAVSETQIAFKPDIYARDAKVLAALNKRS